MANRVVTPPHQVPAVLPAQEEVRGSAPGRLVIPRTRVNRERTVTPRDNPRCEREPSTVAVEPFQGVKDPGTQVALPGSVANAADRRRFLRLPHRAWVGVLCGGRLAFCQARDISMDGVYLRASTPPLVGEHIRVLLVIETDKEALELQGVVVRCATQESGFAARFENMDSISSARLAQVVAEAGAALWRQPAGPAVSTPPSTER